MDTTLAGRHVVITGGTGALGSAVVGALLARGASCHVPVFDRKELERFPFAEHPAVKLVGGVDLRDEQAVMAYYASVPPIWASVQLAGGFSMSPLVATSLGDFERLFTMNVHTCFLACREAVRSMRKGPGGGRLVNVAARPALVPTAGMAAYAASKAAVASLTTSLSEELAPEGIWVNAVVPSTMDTPANRASMPNADFDRWPKVDQVASTIAYLASTENGCTRGALVTVYGRS